MLANAMARRKPWQTLFERLLSNWDERPGADRDAAETRLPAAVYACPERHMAEVAKLFRRLPLCLGHVDQLPPGSVIARSVVGLPLLLARDAEGRVRVLLNACRHRGAKLLPDDEQVCRRASLSCRYHGWTYGLDGKLVSMPRSDAFPTLDRAMHGLHQLPSVSRHGLIWAVLDRQSGKQMDVGGHLGDLDADLAELKIGQQCFFRQNAVVRRANWKLIIDAFIEFYHIKRLHADTIGRFFADAKAAAEAVGPHLRMLVGRDGFAAIKQLPPGDWDPRTHGSLVHFIFPNNIIVHHPDYTSHVGVFPVAVDQTLFVHTVLTPESPADQKAQAHWERSFDLIDGEVFNNEDLFICEQIQAGLPAMAADEFILGRLERNIHRFHCTIADALAAP